MTERWRPAGAEGWLRLPVVSGRSSVVRTGSAGWLAGWLGGRSQGDTFKVFSVPLVFFFFLIFSYCPSSLLKGVWSQLFCFSFRCHLTESEKGNGILSVWHLGWVEEWGRGQWQEDEEEEENKEETVKGTEGGGGGGGGITG